MKILVIADDEINELWQGWSNAEAEKLRDISLILSAGDLHPAYLEFLVTMLNVPLLYVRGNHDSCYDDDSPQGCIDIDDRIVEVEEAPSGGAIVRRPGLQGMWDDFLHKLNPHVPITEKKIDLLKKKPRRIRIAGLGGSMRYGNGKDMYTETEMRARVRRLKFYILQTQAVSKKNAVCYIGGTLVKDDKRKLDIFLTHAPSKGCGDMDDIPHRGFSCFNDFMNELHPAYHLYGHIHKAYGKYEFELDHPSGAKQINVAPMYILEI